MLSKQLTAVTGYVYVGREGGALQLVVGESPTVCVGGLGGPTGFLLTFSLV